MKNFFDARATRHRLMAMLFAGMLATGLLAVRATPAFAWSPCQPWSPAPSTDGLWADGVSHVDCPNPFTADWLKSEFVEWAIPGFYHLRDSSIHNGNSANLMTVFTSYFCNNHGTDDWQNKANARNLGGGESGWLWGTNKSLTC